MSRTAEEQATTLEHDYRDICARYARFLESIARIDQEHVAHTLGHRGTASLLRDRLRMTRSTAARTLREARGLHQCPATLQTMAAGDISPQHLRQILTGVHAVTHLDNAAQHAEQVLLALAIDHDPGTVRTAAAHLRQTLDPTPTETKHKHEHHQTKHKHSVCYLAPTRNGTWNLTATLDPHSGTTLATALNTLTTTHPHTPNPDKEGKRAGNNQDHEPAPVRLSGAQRRAMALVDLAARALTADKTDLHDKTHPPQGALIPAQTPRHTDTPTTQTGQMTNTARTQTQLQTTAMRLVYNTHATPFQTNRDNSPPPNPRNGRRRQPNVKRQQYVTSTARIQADETGREGAPPIAPLPGATATRQTSATSPFAVGTTKPTPTTNST